ncbi:hypothetical protein GDO81_017732 [Engystomops pustulosus]|uniref:Uncharacterized protein n=1 Tax=Engystomops pustulosus TaxID=76066 RepID=A0AAV7A2M8_ENGPU|nr:hypothetical protein GDO81_017732 [Engystomops pustulosus]
MTSIDSWHRDIRGFTQTGQIVAARKMDPLLRGTRVSHEADALSRGYCYRKSILLSCSLGQRVLSTLRIPYKMCSQCCDKDVSCSL